MPGVTDYLSQLSDAVVQAGLVSYFFVHYLMKGRSDIPADEPVLCIDNKPTCCLHGDKPAEQVQAPSVNGTPKSPPPATVAPPAPAAPSWRSAQGATPVPKTPPVPTPSTSEGEPGWFKKALGKYASQEKTESSPISKQSAKTTASKPSSTVQQSSEPAKAEVKDFVSDLKHQKPLHYPSAFEGGTPSNNKNAPAVFTPASGSGPSPAPPGPEETPKIQIPLKQSAPTDGEAQRATIVTQKVAVAESSMNRSDQPALLMMPEQHQIRAQAPLIVYTDSRPFSPASNEQKEGPPEDYRPLVASVSKQWPPPSNATGVEFYKDMWGAPVEAAPVYDPNWNQPQGAHFEPLTLSPTGRMQSSFYSAPESESELGTPRVIRNPQGDVQDYTRMSKDDQEPFTNMMSQDKSQELARFLLGGEVGKGKGVQMFSRQRERVEQFAIEKPVQHQTHHAPTERIIPVQRDVETSRWGHDREPQPPVPTQRLVRPVDIVDSVTEAAARREPRSTFSPEPPPGNYNTQSAGETPYHPQMPPLKPLSVNTPLSSGPPTPPKRLFSPAPVNVDASGPYRQSGLFSPVPISSVGPRSMPSVERLFSPSPYSAKEREQRLFSPVLHMGSQNEFAFEPMSRSRNYEPPPVSAHLEVPGGEKMSQFGVREGAPRSWSGSSGVNKQMTMSTLAVTTPTTRIITNMSPREKVTSSTFNTLPRTWKSFSEAYRN